MRLVIKALAAIISNQHLTMEDTVRKRTQNPLLGLMEDFDDYVEELEDQER